MLECRCRRCGQGWATTGEPVETAPEDAALEAGVAAWAAVLEAAGAAELEGGGPELWSEADEEPDGLQAESATSAAPARTVRPKVFMVVLMLMG